MDDKKHELFAKTDIKKLVWKMSLPGIVAMAIQSLYTLIDKIFIGHYVGNEGLAAMQYVQNTTMLMFAVGIMMAIGAATMYSLHFGKKEYTKMKEVFGTGLFFGTIISIAFGLTLFIFSRNLFTAMGATGQTLEMAMDYLNITLIALPLYFLGLIVVSISRSLGFVKIVAMSMLVSQLINLGLDWLLMGPVDMGMQGAAIGTAVSQILIFIIMIVYIFRHGRKYLPSFSFWRANSSSSRMFRFGFPMFLTQFMMVAAFTIATKSFANIGGQDAVATFSAASSILMFVLLPAFGVRQGIMPIMGFNHSSGEIKRVWKALFYGIKIATIYLFIAATIVILFPMFFLGLFGITDTSTAPAVTRALVLGMWVIPVQIFISVYMSSIGKPLNSIIISIFRGFIIIIPAILLLGTTNDVRWVAMAFPITDVLSTIIVLPIIIYMMKKIKSENKKTGLNPRK